MFQTALHFIEDYWTSGLEILILSVLLYYSYLYLRRTQGTQILIWVAILFFVLTFISQILDLEVLNWLLRNGSAFLAIALMIIFQPELRRALNDLGIHRLFTSALQRSEAIEELTDIVFELSAKGFGGLIAIERDIDLRSIVESGVKLDALLSKDLIITLFHPKTILHDGGVVINDTRVIGAGCIFPLSQRDDLDRTIGLRHRAALGLSEESDAIALVISEETGQVSICHAGTIKRNLNEEKFKEHLRQLMICEENIQPPSTPLERKATFTLTGSGPLVSDYSKSSAAKPPQDIHGEI